MQCKIRHQNVALILFIIVAFFTINSNTNAQSYSLSDEAYISLLTEGPGEELYSGYGHTGIRIKDDTRKLDIVYHYGLFNFNAPRFYANFLKGKLNYSMGGQYYSSFYANAKSDHRDLTEQVLNLNQNEKNTLFQLLNENYQPKNRAYWYDFFFDNCSTRPRDLFEEVWKDKLIYNKIEPSLTFRELLEHHQQYFPWVDFGIDLLHGSNTDKLATVRDEMFLPVFLMMHLRDAKINNQPAIIKEIQTLNYPNILKPKIWEKPISVFILFLILELIIFYLWIKKIGLIIITLYDRLWFILLSLSSILMLLMWFGTEHYAAKNNWNVLWASPLFLWMSIAKLKKLSSKTILIAKIILGVLMLSFLTWFLIPQTYHICVLPIVLILMLKMVRYVFTPQLFSFSKQVNTI